MEGLNRGEAPRERRLRSVSRSRGAGGPAPGGEPAHRDAPLGREGFSISRFADGGRTGPGGAGGATFGLRRRALCSAGLSRRRAHRQASAADEERDLARRTGAAGFERRRGGRDSTRRSTRAGFARETTPGELHAQDFRAGTDHDESGFLAECSISARVSPGSGARAPGSRLVCRQDLRSEPCTPTASCPSQHSC